MTYATRVLEFPRSAAAGRCALVVDGDADQRVALRFCLDVAGWTVWEAPTAAAALRAMQLRGPKVVLLSSQLPDGDAVSVLVALKAAAATAAVPVVVVGSPGAGDDPERSLAAGAFDHVSPPFSGFEIQDRLDRAFRSWDWFAESE